VPLLHAEDSKQLVIGGLIHLTGEAAEQGVAFQKGIELAAAQINKGSGVNGRPIKIIFEDTQYKPTQALTGARKLNEVDHVDAILISTVTEAKSAGPYLQKARIPSIVLWDSSPEIEKLGHYIFGIGPWAPASGESAADFVATKFGAKKVVVIDTNTEWSQYVSQYFQRRFSSQGGKILNVFSANPDEVNFRTIIQRALALKPDVIYAPVDLNVVTFFEQYKQSNSNIPIISSDVIVDNYIIEAPGAFEGVYHTMTGVNDSAEFKEMAALYKAYFNEEILQPQFVSWAYDAVMLIAKAAEKGGLLKNTIQFGILSTKNYLGTSGIITMTEKGSAPREVRVFKVINGKFVKE